MWNQPMKLIFILVTPKTPKDGRYIVRESTWNVPKQVQVYFLSIFDHSEDLNLIKQSVNGAKVATAMNSEQS